jgi:N-acetylglucosaminyldiphosphoundecaprenol N-acetyl-beta-D-mannosaminyltransferase
MVQSTSVSTGKGLPTFDVLGVPVTVTTPVQASETIEGWAKDDIGRFVCIRDVASLMAINDDERIRDLHREAAMITPDGSPLAFIGKLRGFPVKRTCGPDLIDLVARRSVERGLSHYFYGGKEGVAEKLARTFERRYPGFRTAGYECPPFRPLTREEDDAVVERIKASGADIVWVGISSPKQDVWMRDHYHRLPQTLIGVGAAFDFHTGSVKRAPVWMQMTMLEWAYRFAAEPKRLWRRYLIQAPRFVWQIVTRQKGEPEGHRLA